MKKNRAIQYKIVARPLRTRRPPVRAEFVIYVDGVIVDPSGQNPASKRLRNLVAPRLESAVIASWPKSTSCVVRLSGLSNNKKEAFEFASRANWQSRYSFNMARWQVEPNGTYVDFSSLIVIADQNLLQKLLKKYWFSFGKEQRVEVAFVKKKALPSMLSWHSVDELRATEHSVHQLAEFVVDNQHNGFHFALSGAKWKGKVEKRFLAELGKITA